MTTDGLSLSRPDRRAAQRKRRLQITAVALLGALLGAAAGWWVGSLRSPSYVSTASMQVKRLAGNSFTDRSTDILVSLETEAQLARSDEVLNAVAGSGVGPTDVNVLRGKTTVSVVEGSEVVRVSYRGKSADESAKIADALAKATLDERRRRAQAAGTEQLALVAQSLTKVNAELAAANDPTTQRALNRLKVALRSQRSDIAHTSPDPGEVIGVSTVLASRTSFRSALVLAGAAVGACLGWLLARRVGRHPVSGESGG
ncbi:MAG: hypothetical protein WAN48_01585 [Actinomycetes bacterium]